MNKPITKKEWMEYLEKTWDAAQEEALAQPEQEPVAWMCKRDDGHFDVMTDQTCKKCFPVYTTPPQRTWVGLTDEEIDPDAEKSDNYAAFHGGVRFAQAKLKEKNT